MHTKGEGVWWRGETEKWRKRHNARKAPVVKSCGKRGLGRGWVCTRRGVETGRTACQQGREAGRDTAWELSGKHTKYLRPS